MFNSAAKTEPYLTRGQDRAAIIPHPAGLILVVADGAGGTGGGAEAADTVILWANAYASRSTDLRGSAQWVEFLTRLDRQIACAEGQTTAVIVAAFKDGLAGASVGDSAAWLITADGLDDLTAHQIRKPLLGTESARPIGFDRDAFTGTLLLMSDGITKYAKPQKIREAALLPDPQLAAHRIIDAARLPTGGLQDDAAVALCHV